MHFNFSFTLVALWLVLGLQGVFGQNYPVCTRELAATDECADVINPNACYNQYKFSGTRTLSCIDGKDDADRKRKVCQCCTCVGTQMCTWVTQQKFCTGSTTGKANKRAVEF
ncbi:hypothetical protein B0H66DRAFT_532419 [Apodospora peruviana]|uniref:Uncharacterized protein n=1 Tax=Apodospora peruviana TaxID=516989 RepID=A0AAE0M3E8_9PEZI|nr:hypothetical protein B0H66DRAFT_532419 [Apodospora peruviana]